ncbi:MAG: rubrerythrin family protein [Thermoplasmata archaeon]
MEKTELAETKKNLSEAFAGESMANRRYLKFAEVAEKEGYGEVAKLFREIAEQETMHAWIWLKELGGIGNTEENLKSAIEGETYEYTKMYPKFAEIAEKEGLKELAYKFRMLAAIEERHAKEYKKALEALKKNKSKDSKEKRFACPNCGYIAEGEVPKNCPLCGLEGINFKPIFM